MDVGGRLAAGLATMRKHAESRMRSVALVERVTVTTHQTTGADVESVVVVHARLACRVKAAESLAQAGLVSVTEVREVLHVPWNTAGLTVGLRVTILESPSPVVVGNRYRLARPHEADDTTAQRWGVETWAELMS